MPKREIKPIFVRLSETERRRVRTLAVSQGLTMREAVIEAFEAWARQLRSGAPSARKQRGPGAGQKPTPGRDSEGQHQPRYASTSQEGQAASPGSFDSGFSLAAGSLPGLEGLTGDWPARAAQLDWSTCPAAESVQTKRGTIWVATGTLVPLVHVFEAVAQEHPLGEIAEAYGLTLQQLNTLLQVAAAGLSAASAP